MNINILGISELKWTGMGEFNSDDHYIYCCGQESLRRNGALFCDFFSFCHVGKQTKTVLKDDGEREGRNPSPAIRISE